MEMGDSQRVSRTARRALLPVLALAAALAAGTAAGQPQPACDPDDAGLRLAEGFCAVLVGEELGPVRQLAVAGNGDVFAALRGEPGGVLALRDGDGDGRAEVRRRFGSGSGHGIRLHEGFLWFAADERVVRWPWRSGQLEPEGDPQTIVSFPPQDSHERKAIALGPDGALHASVGAPSNACQREARTARSPGLDPCPQLERHAGIWRFAADRPDQTLADGERVATGMRHTLAMAIHPGTGVLWGAINGRDQLGSLWGFSDEANARLPAEELVRVTKGSDFGWPYCYYDGLAGRKVLAPEYGGDGEEVGRCADTDDPALAFPAHWAPMDLAFAPADAFGGGFGNDAFVSFHGSWNRAPLPQEGYRVVHVPFEGGAPAGAFETFAIGAASPTAVRFTGLAFGPRGTLYAAADENGRIWRILREPKRAAPAAAAEP